MIPTGWQLRPLEALVQNDAPICYGILMPGPGVQNGVKVLKVKDMGPDGVNTQGLLMTTPEIDAQYKRSRLQTGDIVVSIRGTTGRVAIIPSDLDQANITQDTARIRTNGCIDRDYLFQALKSHSVQTQIKLHTVGQAVKGINIGEVKRLQILVPPMPEQKKIAEILSCWDRAISKTRAIGALIQRYKESIVADIFSSETTKRRGWPNCSLSDVADVRGGKRVPKGNKLTKTPTAHPYIRVTDMRDGSVCTSDLHYISEEIFNSIRNYTISENDLYISVAGTLGLVGDIPHSLDGANLTENANKISPRNIEKQFLKQVLLSRRIQRQIDAIKTTSAQPKLALTRIRNFEIPLPSPKEQKLIADALQAMDTHIALSDCITKALEKQKQGLVQRLFSGKLRVSA